MENTNLNGVPKVVDPSLKTGRYEVGVINNPELTYKLNQPGAGVSSAAVISIEESTITYNTANLAKAPKVVDSSVIDRGDYKLEMGTVAGPPITNTITLTKPDSTTETMSFTNLPTKLDIGGFELDLTGINVGTTEFNVKTSDLSLGEYTIVVSDYQDEAGKKSANIEVFDPDGFSIGQLASRDRCFR